MHVPQKTDEEGRKHRCSRIRLSLTLDYMRIVFAPERL